MPSFNKFSAKNHLKDERIHPGWFLVEMVHIYVLFNPFQFVRTLFKKKKKKTMKPRKRGYKWVYFGLDGKSQSGMN